MTMQAARRQVPDHAAFFHFRHWDDFIAHGISSAWNSAINSNDAGDIGCMVCQNVYFIGIVFYMNVLS